MSLATCLTVCGMETDIHPIIAAPANPTGRVDCVHRHYQPQNKWSAEARRRRLANMILTPPYKTPTKKALKAFMILKAPKVQGLTIEESTRDLEFMGLNHAIAAARANRLWRNRMSAPRAVVPAVVPAVSPPSRGGRVRKPTGKAIASQAAASQSMSSSNTRVRKAKGSGAQKIKGSAQKTRGSGALKTKGGLGPRQQAPKPQEAEPTSAHDSTVEHPQPAQPAPQPPKARSLQPTTKLTARDYVLLAIRNAHPIAVDTTQIRMAIEAFQGDQEHKLKDQTIRSAVMFATDKGFIEKHGGHLRLPNYRLKNLQQTEADLKSKGLERLFT